MRTVQGLVLWDACRKEGAELWYPIGKGLFFHDPMATVAIFRPDIATYTNVTVSVDVAKGGLTSIDAKPNPAFGLLKVATSVDARAFDDALTNVVTRAFRANVKADRTLRVDFSQDLGPVRAVNGVGQPRAMPPSSVEPGRPCSGKRKETFAIMK